MRGKEPAVARSARQKLKILYVKDLLENESDSTSPLGMEEIIKHLEKQGISAERKSIYDDLDALRDYGMQIVYQKKNPKGYYLKKRHFETAELKLLIDAVEVSKFITEKKTVQLIEKLSAFGARNKRRLFKRQVFVRDRIKSMNESIYHNVDRIHEAISQNRRITFSYYSYDVKKNRILRRDGKRYDISPAILSWSDENYYLIAYDHEAEMIKHYRVDKMNDIQVEQTQRLGLDVIENIDVVHYTQRNFSMFSGEEIYVTISFANELAGVVIDRFGKNITFFPSGEGCFEARVKVALSPFFLGWIAALGDQAVILRPQEAVDAMKELLHKVQENY